MGDQMNNIYLIPLAIYCIAVTFFVIPIYAGYIANERDMRTGGFNLNESIGNISSAGDVNSSTGIIGFFKSLFITFTQPMPAIIITLFVTIPDIWLLVILYDKIRG